MTDAREAEAVAAVERQANAGDADSLFLLANWRLYGMYGQRDIAAAHRLLKKAADRGHVEAQRTRAMLLGNGTGCDADPEKARKTLEKIVSKDPYSALQINFLAQMPDSDSVDQVRRERLCADPFIEMARGVLLPEECRYLMLSAEPRLQPSIVIDPATGNTIPHPVRTSHGTSFGPVEEDLVVHAINRRIARLTGTEVGCGEPLHMLRYAPGQEYRPHMDALPGEGNQRVLTALVYLNGDYLEGETHFPHLNVTARGQAGDVLVFANVLKDGRGDPRTQHAGLPVTAGTKWLATRWIRERPYHPWDS